MRDEDIYIYMYCVYAVGLNVVAANLVMREGELFIFYCRDVSMYVE